MAGGWNVDDFDCPSDIISKISVENKSKEKSNRLCFISEKLNLLGKSDEAIQSLKDAITLDSSNSTALCLLGGIYNEKNSSECTQYYLKSIESNKNCYLAYRGLGNYYLKTKQYDEAEKFYTSAIGINESRFGPIYKNRGIARMSLNKNNDAKKDLENYLKYTPNAKDRDDIIQTIREI